MTEETKKELVDHPAHYTKGKYEHVDVMENWGLGYHLGNATKYMMRSPHKGKEIEDLEKAQWYLTRAVENPSVLTAFVVRSSDKSILSIGEVATDWFGPEIRDPLRKAFFHIGTAALNCPEDDDVREQLTAALTLLTLVVRNKKAEIDAQGK